MTPAAPPFLPNPFRIPARAPKRPAAAWWLVPNRHAGASWQLVEGNGAQDPSFGRGDQQINWMN